jgi:1D-myo-inositol 3-kinase
VIDSVDYLAIGHVTRDILPDASHVVGGTVSYAALTVAALRRSVGIVTSASRGFDLSAFRGLAAISCSTAEHTTTFRNQYVDGSRRQVVYGIAEPLTPQSIPEAWSSPAIVHVGPIMGECDPALATSFPESTFVGITPQGWMRSTNGGGEILHQPWHGAESLLRHASAVVFSIHDILGDWDVARSYAAVAPLLAVTTGRNGGVLFINGEPTQFSALTVDEIDPTGAGDIFAAVFFDALVHEVLPVEAARFAACVASRSVTRVGLNGVPNAEDIGCCRGLLGYDH